MADGRAPDIVIGPRTTVYALLAAYPFLEAFLVARADGFEPLTRPHTRTTWSRVTRLNDVALAVNVTWRQLVREIAAEITRETGHAPSVAGSPSTVSGDDRRLGELREIAKELEDGGSLLDMADRWREATAGLEPAESAALDEALSEVLEAGSAARMRAAEPPAPPVEEVQADLPRGHPLETLQREGRQVNRLCAGLRAELTRLGGSPSRRRWQQERPLVARLVDRLAGIETRFRREQQAWFLALSVHGIEGPQALLAGRQADALETLRRLHLAVSRDDAASVAESGTRLLELLDDLLAQDDQLLVPLAVRHLSPGDWAAVRELEDGVGWRLIPTPPHWPPVSPSGSGADGRLGV